MHESVHIWTGLLRIVPSCSRCGQRRQGSREISTIQDHLYPSEGTSCCWQTLFGFILGRLFDIYLLSIPLLLSLSSTPARRCWRSRGSLVVTKHYCLLHGVLLKISVGETKGWTCSRPPADVTTDEWAFYLLPLDDDIISLELPEFFRDNFLVGNTHRVGDSAGMISLPVINLLSFILMNDYVRRGSINK